jgi:uncharacterized membrane protein (UPF0127 family)
MHTDESAKKPFFGHPKLFFATAFLVLLVCVLVLFSNHSAPKQFLEPESVSTTFETHFAPESGVEVTVGELVVRADVADTPTERKQGLSGRPSLAQGTGMWFVYETADYYTYWMPDMHFALDIIWFDEDLKVVHIQENATPEAYPETYRPNAPARYVLEVPSGMVHTHDIRLGMQAVVDTR